MMIQQMGNCWSLQLHTKSNYREIIGNRNWQSRGTWLELKSNVKPRGKYFHLTSWAFLLRKSIENFIKDELDIVLLENQNFAYTKPSPLSEDWTYRAVKISIVYYDDCWQLTKEEKVKNYSWLGRIYKYKPINYLTIKFYWEKKSW